MCTESMGDHGKREDRLGLCQSHVYIEVPKTCNANTFTKVQRAGRTRIHMRGTGGREEGRGGKREREGGRRRDERRTLRKASCACEALVKRRKKGKSLVKQKRTRLRVPSCIAAMRLRREPGVRGERFLSLPVSLSSSFRSLRLKIVRAVKNRYGSCTPSRESDQANRTPKLLFGVGIERTEGRVIKDSQSLSALKSESVRSEVRVCPL